MENPLEVSIAGFPCMVDNRKLDLYIMKGFVKLPSGIVVNTNNIEYFLGVSAIRQKKARKPSAFVFSIQFVDRDEPITLSYQTKEEADADYNSLAVGICGEF